MDAATIGDYRIVMQRLGKSDRALHLEERTGGTDAPWRPVRTIVLPEGVDVAEAAGNVRAWLEAPRLLGYARAPATLAERPVPRQMIDDQAAQLHQGAGRHLGCRVGQHMFQTVRDATTRATARELTIRTATLATLAAKAPQTRPRAMQPWCRNPRQSSCSGMHRISHVAQPNRPALRSRQAAALSAAADAWALLAQALV